MIKRHGDDGTVRESVFLHNHSHHVSLAGTATSIIFFATNTCLSQQNKSFVATKVLLSRENFCRDQHNFVAAKHKHTFFATKEVFCCNKHMFVATNTCLSRQNLYLWQLPPMVMIIIMIITVFVQQKSEFVQQDPNMSMIKRHGSDGAVREGVFLHNHKYHNNT